MIAIYVCEDDDLQRNNLVDIIKKYVFINGVNAEIVVETNDPAYFRDQLKKRKDVYPIVFLDIEFEHHDVTGIDLAEFVRAASPNAKIVFISSHTEFGMEIIQKRIESYDFIIKDNTQNMKERVADVLEGLLMTNEKPAVSEIIKLNFNDETRYIPVEDIEYFCTVPEVSHKLEVHLANGQFQFYEKLKNIPKLNPALKQCHRAYVVNENKIFSVDKKNKVINLKSGETIPVSRGKLSKFI